MGRFPQISSPQTCLATCTDWKRHYSAQTSSTSKIKQLQARLNHLTMFSRLIVILSVITVGHVMALFPCNNSKHPEGGCLVQLGTGVLFMIEPTDVKRPGQPMKYDCVHGGHYCCKEGVAGFESPNLDRDCKASSS
ncbi:hypothetical protein MJO29_000123 [Puccinia striiformis f. sp. tritici]|nr:hypothetical protein MJO29_000123 [Puccinia striiformis f. sp. tritici]